MTWARSTYETVFFLGGGGTDLLTKRLTAEPIVSTRFPVPEYDSPVNGYPSGVRRKDFEFGLYRLAPAANQPAGPIRLTIDNRLRASVVTGASFVPTDEGLAVTESTIIEMKFRAGLPAVVRARAHVQHHRHVVGRVVHE